MFRARGRPRYVGAPGRAQAPGAFPVQRDLPGMHGHASEEAETCDGMCSAMLPTHDAAEAIFTKHVGWAELEASLGNLQGGPVGRGCPCDRCGGNGVSDASVPNL